MFCCIYYTTYRIIKYFIQRAECWWGAREGYGEAPPPAPQQIKFCYIYSVSVYTTSALSALSAGN